MPFFLARFCLALLPIFLIFANSGLSLTKRRTMPRLLLFPHLKQQKRILITKKTSKPRIFPASPIANLKKVRTFASCFS